MDEVIKKVMNLEEIIVWLEEAEALEDMLPPLDDNDHKLYGWKKKK